MSKGFRMSAIFCLLCWAGLSISQDKEPQEAKDNKPYVNTIKWATASEVDNFGFDVYRSEKEDGPFTKINETPVEGAGTTDSPSYYKYEDDTIDPRKVYYYYVESISMDGIREHFTPVIKAKPKIVD